MKLSKLIPTIACSGIIMTMSPLLSSCTNSNFNPIIEWEEGQTFIPTIPPKEFKDGEGVFEDKDAYLAAYNTEVRNNPIIFAEDLVCEFINIQQDDNIKIDKPSISTVSLLVNSYFRFSGTIFASVEIGDGFKLEDKFFYFNNVPIQCRVGVETNETDIKLGPVPNQLFTDNKWSIKMPDPYSWDINKTYNSKVLYKAFQEQSFTYDWFLGLLSHFLFFKSTYFQNATITEE